MPTKNRLIIAFAAFALLFVSGLGFTATNAQQPPMPQVKGHIYELAIRYILDPEKAAEFQKEISAKVMEKDPEAVIFSGEFLSVFGLAPELDPKRPIQIGISEYKSVEQYFALAQAFADDPIVPKYFATIETIQNVLMIPKDGEEVDASELAACGVLEVAVRDVSGYKDMKDFEAKMDAFIKVLGAQKGVVREYQFVSLDEKHFVGMTCYESIEANQKISTDPALLQDPAVGALFASYPPLVAQMTIPVPEDEEAKK